MVTECDLDASVMVRYILLNKTILLEELRDNFIIFLYYLSCFFGLCQSVMSHAFESRSLRRGFCLDSALVTLIFFSLEAGSTGSTFQLLNAHINPKNKHVPMFIKRVLYIEPLSHN